MMEELSMIEIYQKFLNQGHWNDLVTENKEDGLHAHIKQERSVWVKKAIEFTIKEMKSDV